MAELKKSDQAGWDKARKAEKAKAAKAVKAAEVKATKAKIAALQETITPAKAKDEGSEQGEGDQGTPTK